MKILWSSKSISLYQDFRSAIENEKSCKKKFNSRCRLCLLHCSKLLFHIPTLELNSELINILVLKSYFNSLAYLLS